jgi:hypothetical protein
MSEQAWEDFKAGIVSGAVYQKRVNEYFEFCVEEGKNRDDMASLLFYLTELHKDGDFAAKTLWTINSMICAWFVNVHNKNPVKDLLTIKASIKRWEKAEETKKATAFTAENISTFLKDAPNDHVYLPIKIATILGIYGFQRRAEMKNMIFENIKFNSDGILVEFDRVKTKDN